MGETDGAYATKAGDTDFRKKWDKEAYAEKARKRDMEEAERMQENEARLKQGKKPRRSRREDLPKPTDLMKRREGSLELDKNLNKTIVVQNPGNRGPGQPGFYCAPCNRTYKDSTGYLDHINGRAHLRMIGQTTRLERSTVEQVRARIALLREQTRQAAHAKAFDFDQRLAEVREQERAARAEKKRKKKEARDQALQELATAGAETNVEGDEMALLMGFGTFGSTKKK